MDANKCTASNIPESWREINFVQAERRMKKLQKRITAAYQDGNMERVDSLQQKIIHSFYAKALAVKLVSKSSTPGIDDIVWKDSKDCYKAIFDMRRRGYHPKPLKRVYKYKSNGRFRPLSIPTLKDRAMQTLYRFALEPIGYATADEHSYAFLPKRGARDAIARLKDILMNYPRYQWILKADVKSCFDDISHEWIIEHIPIDKVILERFLKCGYVKDGIRYPTPKGVPQGGCISCVICNMTLDGLEVLLKSRFENSVEFVRYADDIVVVGETLEILVRGVIPVIKMFLAERGLSLSDEKTHYFRATQGVHVLGWEVFRQQNSVIAVPLSQSIDRLLRSVVTVYQKNQALEFEKQCNKITQRIRGWLNYYIGIAPPIVLSCAVGEAELQLYQLTGDVTLAEVISKFYESYMKQVNNKKNTKK